MRIGIDARLFVNQQFTGISRSVYEDLKVWKDQFPQHEYFLLSRRPIHIDFELPPNWHIVNTPWIIDKGKFWAMFELPKLIKELRLDAYWGTNYSLPKKIKRTKYYVTIYDLALFKFKGIGATTNTIRLKLFAKSACKKADKVIAISQATASDVEEIFGISKDKIKVSYCGGMPSDFKRKLYKIETVNNMLKFKEPYFLFISTIEPRKNISVMVQAFEKFVDATGSDMKLVLAGRKGWKSEDIYKTIETCKYKNRIVMPGFISDNDKEYLLSNADVFLYPSLYEGFGIPILEAMEYGLPVITTNVSSMPEVGGDAAFYINNPSNIEELASMMVKVHILPREELISCEERMKIQCNKFSWEKNAVELMELMESKNLEEQNESIVNK